MDVLPMVTLYVPEEYVPALEDLVMPLEAEGLIPIPPKYINVPPLTEIEPSASMAAIFWLAGPAAMQTPPLI